MSNLIIEIGQVDNIKPHENADLLELAIYKGWQCIVRRGQFKAGDLCVYFPPETLLSQKLGEELNVTKYLKGLGRTYPNRERYAGRVSVARLRGTVSYGILASPNADWLLHADNLSEYLEIEKYSPPEEMLDGDGERTNPFFHKYTDMENLRNFPRAFIEGEEVICTEKIHGSNVRIGLCYEEEQMVLMAGSHGVRRKELDHDGRPSKYWKPVELCPRIKDLLHALHVKHQGNVILWGEIYGATTQDLTYGEREIQFRAFDISINTAYLDYDVLAQLLDEYNIPMAPLVYRGPFSWEEMEKHVGGNSVVSSITQIREGIVIRPEKEENNHGRKIYKLISFDYLNRKSGTENH